jgi:hypothetical protein
MDPTLTQLVAALFQAHQTIDHLHARVTELETLGQQQVEALSARIAELEAPCPPSS